MTCSWVFPNKRREEDNPNGASRAQVEVERAGRGIAGHLDLQIRGFDAAVFRMNVGLPWRIRVLAIDWVGADHQHLVPTCWSPIPLCRPQPVATLGVNPGCGLM